VLRGWAAKTAERPANVTVGCGEKKFDSPYIATLYIGRQHETGGCMGDRFEKDLLRGSWDLMILSVLAHGRKYGYLIQKEVREASGGRAELQAGTLYPILHRLEQEKLIRSFWDDDSARKRKWYQLTPSGQKRLQVQAQQWTDYAACVRQFLDLAGLTPSPI
jgi:PadR family transcriptional regulator PadR